MNIEQQTEYDAYIYITTKYSRVFRIKMHIGKTFNDNANCSASAREFGHENVIIVPCALCNNENFWPRKSGLHIMLKF